MRPCFCCDNVISNIIDTIKITKVDTILNDELNIIYCNNCNLFFSDSNNTQNDYNKYYTTFNNYKNEKYCLDKDERCSIFLKSNLKNVNTILDYGSGNGVLSQLLENEFKVDIYDIGMDINTNVYDCLILSHVLEHIYDVNEFIINISKNITNNGYLYIEVPNSEFYHKMVDLCPLQEINIEHINFFSKFALNKLLIKHNFSAVCLYDDYFIINQCEYPVIRALFKKNVTNNSFIRYIESGKSIIDSYNFQKLKQFEKIYIYGCGQFLFKIFNRILEQVNVINIIDDNTSYTYNYIEKIKIINFETYLLNAQPYDTILIASLIHYNAIQTKITTMTKNINIINITEL